MSQLAQFLHDHLDLLPIVLGGLGSIGLIVLSWGTGPSYEFSVALFFVFGSWGIYWIYLDWIGRIRVPERERRNRTPEQVRETAALSVEEALAELDKAWETRRD